MLFNTGILSRLGRVEDGTTASDYHPEEIAKQITIHTSLVPCEWNGIKINLLDTPGFSDFIGEVKGALRVSDAAMFVVSAVDGVEVQHEVIWDMADGYDLPRIVFINKMDRENSNFEKVLDDLKSKFKANFVPVQIPIGSFNTFKGVVDIINGTAYEGAGKGKEITVPAELADEIEQYREQLIEAAAEGDDDLTMKYLEGEELTPDEIKDGLKNSIALRKVVPVLAGSATKNIGVAQLMDFVAGFLPAPETSEGNMSALVFKTIADPYVGKMNFLRVYSGNFKSDSTVLNSTKEKNERIGNVLFVRGKNTVQTDVVPAGDLAVVVKLQDTGTGDTLCDKDKPWCLKALNSRHPP
jgi:elongation factor G